MKKLFLKSITLICIFLVIGGLGGCSNPEILESKGHFFETSLVNFPSDVYMSNNTPIYQREDSAIVLMASKEETAVFADTYSQSYSETEQQWVKDNRFTNLINHYDDEFFESKQIVTFFVTAAGGAYYFELDKVIYSGGVLTVRVNHISAGVGHCALVNWFAIVEIEKVMEDVEIVVQVKNRG